MLLLIVYQYVTKCMSKCMSKCKTGSAEVVKMNFLTDRTPPAGTVNPCFLQNATKNATFSSSSFSLNWGSEGALTDRNVRQTPFLCHFYGLVAPRATLPRFVSG